MTRRILGPALHSDTSTLSAEDVEALVLHVESIE